jgi:peptide chain release factor subunit 1
MITRHDVESLLKHEAKASSFVLSIYLHVDRSLGLDAIHQMQTSLKQRLKEIELQLDKRAAVDFATDAARVLRSLADHKPRGQSFAIFCDDSEDFFRLYALNAPLRDGVWWGKTPHVRPLLELFDEYERFGVILTDKAQARLFTVFLGEIEEQREAFAASEVKHIKAPSKDRLRSQMNIQRKTEMYVLWHLKHVAEMMDRLADFHSFDRLVLAGPVEATSELRRLLSKRLRSRVVGTLTLSIQASEQQVLDETLKIEQEIERAAEIELVEELITIAAKQGQAAQGLEPTLDALRKGRIWRLVYADGLDLHGKVCSNCSSLFVEDRESCVYCEAELKPVDDLIEHMAESVIDGGGEVELVQGLAAQRLLKAGGIGAFLRF